MAIQKSFVIRNGIEVNNNLLVANAVTDSVGIGTSNPNYTLEVRGGIGVTDITILGIGTVLSEFNVGTGGTAITALNTGLTGFGTASPAYIVDIRSPVSTGQTALYVQGDIRITGDVYADDISLDQASFTNLEVTGVGTIRTASIDLGYVKTGIVTNLSTSGIGTITTASIDLAYVKTGITTNLITTGIGTITTASIDLAYVKTGIVTNLSTSGIGTITTASIDLAYVKTGITTNLITTGIASIATGVVTTISGSNLSYSGIGSFGSVNADTSRINTGITTNLITTGIASIATGVVTTITGANLNYSGIGSFGSVNAATGRIATGIITTLTGTTLNYSGIGTIADFKATSTTISGLTTTGSLAVASGFDVYAADSTFHGNLTVGGNLSIGGTSAILNAVQVRVEDKDIILGFTTSITPTDDTANHGGVAIASTEGTPLVSLAVAGINTLPDTYKQIMWVKRNTMGAGTTDAFLFNYGVGIGSTQVPNGVELAVGSVQITDNTINATNVRITNLNASGITTSNSYNVNGTQVISSGRELQNIASLDATTTATIETAIANAPNTSQDIIVTGIASINTGVFTSVYSPTGIITTLSGSNINYSGIGSFGSVNANIGRISTGIVTNLTTSGIASITTAVVDLGYVKTGIITNLTTSGIGTIATAVVDLGYVKTGVITTISGTTLNYSGVSTIANFRITPIGSGATVGNSGIVTYYGDGSQLSNIISGVGIRSTGTLIGTGFTTLNFIGVGNTFAVNGTTIDIAISGGSGSSQWVSTAAGIHTFSNVGIGTTNPAYKLDVNGGNIRSYGSTAPGIVIQPISGSFYTFGANTSVSGLGIYDNTGGSWRLFVKDTTGNVLINNTSETGTASQPLQVTGGAYVSTSLGVGRTNPGVYALDVNGIARIGSAAGGKLSVGTGMASGEFGLQILPYSDRTELQAEQQGTSYRPLSLQPFGSNVGVGVTNPQNPLHISGSAGTLLRLDAGSGGTGTRDIFFSEFNTAAYGGIIRYDSVADLFTFGTVENSVVVNAINVTRTSGLVGIGTTTPSFKADIAGDARITNTNKMRFGGTTATTNFYIQYNSTANSLDFVAG
jgi:hypothetical protein